MMSTDKTIIDVKKSVTSEYEQQTLDLERIETHELVFMALIAGLFITIGILKLARI